MQLEKQKKHLESQYHEAKADSDANANEIKDLKDQLAAASKGESKPVNPYEQEQTASEEKPSTRQAAKSRAQATREKLANKRAQHSEKMSDMHSQINDMHA